MTRLKLADLADEKPVRLTVEVSARLHRELLALVASLRKLGQMTNRRGHPLGGNFELIDVLDLVGRGQVTRSSAPRTLSVAGLEEALTELESLPDVRLVFESPLRLRRCRADRRPRAGYFDADYFDPRTFLQSAARRLEDLGEEPPAGEPPDLVVRERRMAWLDLSYGRWPRRKHTGGVMGEVAFARPPRPWLRVLMLAQLVQVGWMTSFGYGRYRIEQVTF